MRYFYIIMRNGFMHEIPFSEQGYKGAFQQLTNKGIIATIPKGSLLPIAINSVDIAEILNEDAYESFVKQQKPKEYISDGVWYDGKERKMIRVEDWKAKEMRETKRIEPTKNTQPTMTAEQIKAIEEKKKEISKKFASTRGVNNPKTKL